MLPHLQRHTVEVRNIVHCLDLCIHWSLTPISPET
jgi:hypothetical protein